MSIVFQIGTAEKNNKEIVYRKSIEVVASKGIIGDRYLGFVEILSGLSNGDKIVAEGTKKVRPNLTIRPIEKGSKKKQGNSGWGKKDKSKKAIEKKGKFDWLKNIFKKSEKEKK